MNIKIGPYLIRSDGMNYWVEEEYTDKRGKAAYRKIAGYSRNLTELYVSFVTAKLRGIEADTMDEFLNAAAALESEIIHLWEDYNHEMQHMHTL